MSNMNLYLPADGFRSHRHSGTDISLYHVYDSLSQTPYVPGYGISCGDPNTYLIHPQHLITYANIGKHLRWQNREPTIFISLFDNLEAAHSEAQRRVSEPLGQRSCSRQGSAQTTVFRAHRRSLGSEARLGERVLLLDGRTHPDAAAVREPCVEAVAQQSRVVRPRGHPTRRYIGRLQRLISRPVAPLQVVSQRADLAR